MAQDKYNSKRSFSQHLNGIRPGPVLPKKKSTQVSFREGAEIVGVSQTTTRESPILANPQYKDAAKKGWFGLGKLKTPLGTIPAEDDMEEVMKPRPVLPSF